jgi:hypothetical protein
MSRLDDLGWDYIEGVEYEMFVETIDSAILNGGISEGAYERARVLDSIYKLEGFAGYFKGESVNTNVSSKKYKVAIQQDVNSVVSRLKNGDAHAWGHGLRVLSKGNFEKLEKVKNKALNYWAIKKFG